MNDINNINNNNNNNNIEPLEILFFKVFRNKFLFNKIINQIPLLSFECKELTNYYVGNKLKFKDIQDLDWFFGRDNQSSLKLLKLKCKYKEELQVTITSLYSMLKSCKDEEILEYIFENYKTNFFEISTFNLCASSNNKVAFDFFKNKINKDPNLLNLALPIDKTTIENILSGCELYFVENILQMAPVISDSIKEFIFKTVSTNKKCNEIIPFLISNPQYYS